MQTKIAGLEVSRKGFVIRHFPKFPDQLFPGIFYERRSQKLLEDNYEQILGNQISISSYLVANFLATSKMLIILTSRNNKLGVIKNIFIIFGITTYF